jgi:hypothetical protein
MRIPLFPRNLTQDQQDPPETEKHRRKQRFSEIQAGIRQILMSKWDPIGINDVPEATDEYYGYVGGIYRLLASAATDEEISKHLQNIETESMGMTNASGEPLLPEANRAEVVTELQRFSLLQHLADPGFPPFAS